MRAACDSYGSVSADRDGQKSARRRHSFVAAAGFKGTWENITPTHKVYFILG